MATDHRDTRRTEGSGRSAILADGRVNVSRIEREIANELAEDRRFSAEDGMKKRAVHMSKDYNEFKKFVAVSQLEPIQSSEMEQLFVQRLQGERSAPRTSGGRTRCPPNKACKSEDKSILYSNVLRSSAGGASSARHEKDSSGSVSIKLAPQNAMELEREWRRWCKTPHSTFLYLTLPTHASGDKIDEIFESLSPHGDAQVELFHIPERLRLCPEDVAKLCKVEMDSDMSGDILEALEWYIAGIEKSNQVTLIEDGGLEHASRKNFVYRWMKSLTECGRFSLNIDFLDARQKNCAYSILQHLAEDLCRPNNDTANSQNDRSFIFVEGDVQRLGKAYGILVGVGMQ